MVSQTVSTKRRRTYTHRFDHDHARWLYEAGWTYEQIAHDMGVSWNSVVYALDPRQRAQAAAQHLAWSRRARCIDCGGPCTRTTANDAHRCVPCGHAASITSVRPDALWCSACATWQPDEAYGRSGLARHTHRRNRRMTCRACETIHRRDRRRRGLA